MSEDSSKPDPDHWRQLARELGLEPDQPPAPRASEPVPAPVAPEPAPDEDAGHELPSEFEAPEPHELPAAAPLAEASMVEPLPEAFATEEAGEDEGRGRRGRGRRRRGRGRGERRPAAEEGAGEAAPREAEEPVAADLNRTEPEEIEATTEAEEEGTGSENGEREGGRRKRRRRRRRRKGEDVSAAGEPVDELEEGRPELEPEERDEGEEADELPAPAVVADDDEPEEDFSDWDVPSWNELIASLYRPER